ncbi:NAD(P)H-quinone oxidoreductase [Polynucleobacter sp. MWH-Spelu-300-X4]|uniref:NAD(P)H-quinone oxidoreductase n=1 Tax=Polynucleobacter sp. MWH-Spelu-300-X4 TaxID=2689109 RepID=UPI001BFE8DC1|nr:NAD(P)H-quinone oxidoreductase [Polynucleobacter sp. MWH-Spelu-300-X4]QWD79313.1 NAD(P)H-quinone oxidoreductase [Polynucleobacter sp. MWH-Spelu-300-X4]
MRAVEISQYGGPEVLKAVTRPDLVEPDLGSGQVLIRVRAAGINRPDILQRQGFYPVPPGASDLPGLEIAGEIVGGDLTHADNFFSLGIGHRVCALVAGGGYAEYCIAPLAQCLPVPKGLSDVEAASLPETFFTVWSNVFDRARLGLDGRGKETLLVQGGSSGIGVTAIQIAKAMGHDVIVTVGNDDKLKACLDLGADLAINYKTHDFVEEVKNFTKGVGANVIIDMVAGSYLGREINCLADDGRIVVIAHQGGKTSEVDANQIMRRRLTITGSTLRPRSVEFKGAIARALRAYVWPLIEERKIRPVIYETFVLEAAVKAHQLMESSQHIGKIVLTVD